MHAACRLEDRATEIVRMMLDLGVDPYARIEDSIPPEFTAPGEAAKVAILDLLRLFEARSVDLHRSHHYNVARNLKMRLQQDRHSGHAHLSWRRSHAAGANGRTPLILASTLPDGGDLAKIILEHNSNNVDGKDNNDETALQQAKRGCEGYWK
ncbi:hypothetical protein BB8028_0004g09080 [Beauveria bassiana]|uniref:Ankyrin repeat protein n=1 Tax=Beauveria bassiana TaxID=176275 RepID=A0A2S7YCY8_BEABA|nr:hypothetical protein BB8028_0004g09080 [Beauveria bassiana]